MKNICWMRWKSYDSEMWTDHAEFVVDDLLLKVFKLHKLRRSLGHMERMHWMHFFRGSPSKMHYWHYDGYDI